MLRNKLANCRMVILPLSLATASSGRRPPANDKLQYKQVRNTGRIATRSVSQPFGPTLNSYLETMIKQVVSSLIPVICSCSTQ